MRLLKSNDLIRHKLLQHRSAKGCMKARSTHIYTVEDVATMIGENLELLQEIAANFDNIDYGEMVHIHTGSDNGTTSFTTRGIESLQEFLAEIRSWNGGVREILVYENCDPEMIARVMADEANLSV